ncbi:hypothetical protein NA56DRAFT_700483 [Hyaloscypha hepaticicola]|uniref:Uncharacterized protein n=1 Tax=Hyaloscypha hepaticicola TaxID=2082293 RepID=A0A2J6QCM2_9HELO|nr:hypothetical protein NA56DRAFT_700483 [Hyaloscypha hepaticicola]
MAGCVERDIVSAGGPKISCLEERQIEFIAAEYLPSTKEQVQVLQSVYANVTGAAEPYVPMNWSGLGRAHTRMLVESHQSISWDFEMKFSQIKATSPLVSLMLFLEGRWLLVPSKLLHNILSADFTPRQVADFRISGAASTFRGKPSNFSVANCINKPELSDGSFAS